jgi:hypothetical protein
MKEANGRLLRSEGALDEATPAGSGDWSHMDRERTNLISGLQWAKPAGEAFLQRSDPEREVASRWSFRLYPLRARGAD